VAHAIITSINAGTRTGNAATMGTGLAAPITRGLVANKGWIILYGLPHSGVGMIASFKFSTFSFSLSSACSAYFLWICLDLIGLEPLACLKGSCIPTGAAGSLVAL
jgi:hypothetical protein